MENPNHSYTLDLFDSPPAVIGQAPGGYRALAIAELAQFPGQYPKDFVSWLNVNWPIWTTFCRVADELRGNGRRNYSARAIFHGIRLDSDLRERSPVRNRTPVFKINNNYSAACARLYNAMSSDRCGFFLTRDPGQ